MNWSLNHDSIKGIKKPENQDRVVAEELGPGVMLAAIFDGHGKTSDVANYCARTIRHHLAHVREGSAQEYLITAYQRLACETVGAETSGSTASTVLLFDSGLVVSAVLGDSLILVKQNGAIWQSPDHNVVSNEKERMRVIARGGEYRDGYIFSPKTGARHQVTRAFGDMHMHGILSSQPEIFTHRVEPGEWVVVMSDGIVDPTWATYPDDKAKLVSRVGRGCDAKELTPILYSRKGDDASAIICRFNPPEEVRLPVPRALLRSQQFELPRAEVAW